MFLALFSSTEHATSEIKTKIIYVLSVSGKFWYKKHFIILYFSKKNLMSASGNKNIDQIINGALD